MTVAYVSFQNNLRMSFKKKLQQKYLCRQRKAYYGMYQKMKKNILKWKSLLSTIDFWPKEI